MKRIISMALVIVMVLSMSFMCVSCGTISHKKVQSITYQTSGSSFTTLSSSCSITYKTEAATQEEYQNFIKDQTVDSILGTRLPEHIAISEDKKVTFLDDTMSVRKFKKEYEGKTCYVGASLLGGRYEKTVIESIEVHYVTVKFVNANTIEIKSFDPEIEKTITERVKTENYKITYFNKINL